MSGKTILPKSLDIFQKQCTQALGSSIDLTQAKVSDQIHEKGKFTILYEEPAKDLFCSMDVDFNYHDAVMYVGSPTTEKARPISAWQMEDACSVAKIATGNDLKFPCQDGVVDVKILDVIQKDSIKKLTQKCVELFDQFSLYHYQKKLGYKINSKRWWFQPPKTLDEIYPLIYTNRNANFFCEGAVNLNKHLIGVRHGKLDEINATELPNDDIEMTDACSLTRELMKGTELAKEVTCQDRTQGERTAIKGLEYGFQALMTGVFLYSLKKMWSAATKKYATLQVIKQSTQELIKRGLTKVAGKILAVTAVLKAGDWIYSKFQEDYEKSVNKRVADMIFSAKIHPLNKWDLLIVPFLGKVLINGLHEIFPATTNKITVKIYRDLKSRLIEFDRIQSIKAKKLVLSKVRRLLAKDSYGRVNENALKLLRQPMDKAPPELKKALAKDLNLETKYVEMLIFQIQDGAKYLVEIGQKQNDWARQAFNQDGTLMAGLEYRKLINE